MTVNPTRIGGGVEFGDVSVRLDEVEPIRQTVVNELTDLMPHRIQLGYEPEVNELRPAFLGTMRTRPTTAFDDVPEHAITVKYEDFVSDSFWRLVISRFKFKEFDRYFNTRVVYKFEAYAGELVTASRVMLYSNADTNIEVDENGEPLIFAQNKKHKVYERPINSEDCIKINGFLKRAIERAKHQH